MTRVLWISLFAGCASLPFERGDDEPWAPQVDVDGDGWAADGDCDDLNAAWFPGADDPRGDGEDSNCDGLDGEGVSLTPFVFFEPPNISERLLAGYRLAPAEFDGDTAAELVVSSYQVFDDDLVGFAAGPGALWVVEGIGGGILASWEGDIGRAEENGFVIGEHITVGRFVGDDLLDDLVFSSSNQYFFIDGAVLAGSSFDEATRIPTVVRGEPNVTVGGISALSAFQDGADVLAVELGFEGWSETRLYELAVGESTTLDRPVAAIPTGSPDGNAVNVEWLTSSPIEFVMADRLMNNGAGTVRVGASLALFESGSEVVLQGEHAGDWFGDEVSSSEAIDGGGGRVLWVGASGYPDNVREGILYGMRVGETAVTASWTITGRSDGVHRLGITHVTADFDADGWLDLAVGAPADPSGQLLSRDGGAVHVFFGPLAPGRWTSDDADLSFVAESMGDAAGWEVRAADLTGDGVADLVVSAPWRDGFDGTGHVGRVYLVPGPLR